MTVFDSPSLARHRQVLVLLVAATLGWGWCKAAAAQPTAHWLSHYGLQSWQTVFDQDGDSFTAEEEFNWGTDPLNAASIPYGFANVSNHWVLRLGGTPEVLSYLQTSVDLLAWEPVTNLPPATNWIVTLPLPTNEPYRFYRVGSVVHTNSDGDCLLDFEELTIYGTNPLLTDTDGDGINDCDEVKLYHTDPNYSSPTGRGVVQGKVVLDEDGDPATQNHPGLAGWTVFLDLDRDGALSASEPQQVSGTNGSFDFRELDPGLYRVRVEQRPGWVQVFPATSPPLSPDGFADRVVSYFDSGTGPIAGPYGKPADPLPGLRAQFPAPPPTSVPASVVLGAPPPPPISAPLGSWAHVDWLSLPKDSTLTVAFDGEEIVDGPGADLIILCESQGAEMAELYLGSTEFNLTLAGTIQSDDNIAIDLATLSVPQPVRFLKLKALDLLGLYPGFDLVGFAAVNYRALPSGHYDVNVVGGQTVSNVNFGVLGQDHPPRVFVSLDINSLRAGDFALATVTASDDVGITNVTLLANGVTVTLNSTLQAQVSAANGGLLELAARVTDTAGQSADTLLQLVVRNADGTLPDLSGYGVPGGTTGGPSIRVSSPVAGEILNMPRTIVGTISGTASAVTSWRVDYARADLVNPLSLAEADPDYVLLNQGAGPVQNAALGTLAGDTLPAGAYLIRVSATDLNGTTAYLGFVIGVRVDPLDIRPDIIISSPTNESTLTFVTDIRGSITTRQQLREWYVEFAPLSSVNLQNLAGAAASWTRIASGTNAMTNAVLARFDTTLLPNDSYVVRVSAWNQNGLGWAEPLAVHVIGSAKLGNFAVEFTDVSLPLAGIPVTIKRVYNSLNASRSGDFGHGWSLGLQDADIAETVPRTGSGFLSTAFVVGARIYLTAPDGQRIGFTFQPEVGGTSFLGTVWRAVFKPDPGVRYTLAVPEGDTPFLTIGANGEAALFFIPVPWNPDTYILTDLEGTRYTYEQLDGLLEIADLSGNRVTFGESAIEHSAGPRVELVRDSAGRITQIVGPDGRTWSYQYDVNGDLAQMTHPGNMLATFGYATNRQHFLETINDPLSGPTRRTEYDANGRVTAYVDAAGNRIEQSWDPGSFTGTVTDARGNVTELTYNARGNLTRREDPLGGVTTWEYANANFPDRETATADPRGNRTTYTYDSRGNLLQETHPLSKRTIYTYDANDRVLSKSYGTGGTETFAYDAQGRMVHYNSTIGDWAITYTASGLPAALQDGEGGPTRYEYDGAFKLPARVISPDGSVRQFFYDRSGRVTNYFDPLGASTGFEYDSAGRLVRQIDAAGGVVHFGYDAVFSAKPSTTTNRAGRVTLYAYDAAGRLERITAPGGALTRYEYDADGNRTAVVDALGYRTEFAYDKLSRLVEETDPLGQKRTYTYDLAGNRTQIVDRNGRKRTFVFDALNRTTQERWHDPLNDAILRTFNSTYDRLDRLTQVSDPDAVVSFSHQLDPGGQVGIARATYPGLPERLLLCEFDQAGRRTKWNLLGALTTVATYDLSGQLRILTGDVNSTNRWRVEYWRNARGDVTELRRFADHAGAVAVGNTVYTNDPCGCNLATLQHRDAANVPLPGASMMFTRDGEGGITGLLDGANSRTFNYDAAGQLVVAANNGAPVENYSYDANGNRLTSHLQPNYTNSPGNRLTGSTHFELAYDGEGNLVSKSNRLTGDLLAFTWDHRNRLTRVSKTNVALPAENFITDYRYDGLDRRIAVIRGGQTNWTYYEGSQPVAEYLNNETTPFETYFTGERTDELHAVYRRGEGFYWTLTDHLGSVRRVLQTNGVEVAALQYDSFGNLLAATGTRPDAAGRFAFTGREHDADAGLYYNRARYYDPELGRFISADPIGLQVDEPNLYRYARNDPLHFKDPTGKVTAAEYEELVNILDVGVLVIELCDLAKDVGELYAYWASNVAAALSGKPSGGGGVPGAVTEFLPTPLDLLPVNPECYTD